MMSVLLQNYSKTQEFLYWSAHAYYNATYYYMNIKKINDAKVKKTKHDIDEINFNYQKYYNLIIRAKKGKKNWNF